MNLSVYDAGTISEGAHLAGLLPYLEQYIGKLERTLDFQTMQRLDHGELSPQDALNAWQEKRAIRKVLSHFKQVIRGASTVAERNIEELNNGS